MYLEDLISYYKRMLNRVVFEMEEYKKQLLYLEQMTEEAWEGEAAKRLKCRLQECERRRRNAEEEIDQAVRNIKHLSFVIEQMREEQL